MRGGWLTLLLAGCATTTPPPRIPFEEAMAGETAAPSAPLRPTGALAQAVERFTTRARELRAHSEVGARMPPAQAAAWAEVLGEVDRFLARPLAESSALDAVRTRLQLETQLEADAQQFGDVPSELADRVQLVLRQLSARLTALSAKRPKVNPAHFAWPVRPVVMTSPFGHRVHPITSDYRFHAGVDLEAEDAQPVYAAEAGLVVFCGWNGAHGKQVEVQHDAHLSTRYSHLQTLLATPGKLIQKGALLGLAGHTGQVTGPHLHFELRRDGEALDPEEQLPPPPRSPSLVTR